ncbi:retrotransposon protein, putative, ty1-copia subclass, partial [Tanacetum coccineum]
LGKITRKPFPHRPERATDLLGIIHTDVCGPLRHMSRQGASYFITFMDDYSRYGYVYLLKHKHELTPPYTPQHNDMSERRKHTLLDMVRSTMNLTTLRLSFWDYALESVIRILNMVPTKKFDKTPYELWYGNVPNLSCLKIDAMNAEIQSMMDNMVWVLVDLPPGYKTIGNKWIFKKKTDMDGIVHTYKARLVAKSYTQLYGVDYEETFLPVADIRAIRILIYIAAYYDYEIWKMDVKTAFLNGYLDEDIYIV